MNDKLESLRLGLVQAKLRWREPEANRGHLEELLARAGEGMDLAILPETFTTGFLGDPGVAEEGMEGETVEWMQAVAARRECVLAGSAVITTPAGRRNRLLWVQPDGTVQFYDKRHLFGMGGEEQRYVAGDERVVFHWRGWRICPQVCYDIRFPVWCRNRNDYDLLLVVANWPQPRVDAWSLLLRARAVENQCFVAAVNRVGEDGNGVRYPGASVVHDPMGGAVLQLGGEECLQTARVDLATVREVREKLPFLRDADDFHLKP